MVATVAAPTAKKCPLNIRTGSVPAPVLVSPISVAHASTMPGSEGGKKGANWMRDQWVANLKKKRMTTGDGDLPATTASVTSVGTVPVVKAGIRAEASRPASAKTSSSTTSKPKRTTKSKTTKNTSSSDASTTPSLAMEKEGLSLMQSAMFFNDLGSFELESPSFMRLTPTMRDGNGGTPFGALPSPAIKADNKWMKPLMKKRSNCFSSDMNSEPKRRTPRRQYSHGGSFDESDTSSQHSYTSVGTPSNFNSADVARMWGPELDFPNGYVDTFLDLPTPRSAELSGAYVLSTPTALSLHKHNSDGVDELEQPKLIRTTSFEQEGLSHFFEQTTLGNSCDTTRSTSKPQHLHSGFYTPRQAAARAVDDYFGKIVPSPAHYSYSNARCLQPTPRGTLRLQHTGREYNFDPKKPTPGHGSSTAASSEFDTLVQEYEFTDFDQELDTFYLDSMESFGNDMDLVSS